MTKAANQDSSLHTHKGENPNGIGEHNLNLQDGTSLWQIQPCVTNLQTTLH